MIRLLFAVLFAVLVTAFVFCGDAMAQCSGGSCATSFSQRIFSPPPVMYQPRVSYQPMQYQGSAYQQFQYPTPLRNLFFGFGSVHHQYAPFNAQSQQQPQGMQYR